MTDHHDPLDDLASAHLDGLTTADERARIDADPDLTARVERLARARDAVRAPGAGVDPARRDLAIAAALDAFDATADGGRTSADDHATTVTSLPARAARARRALQLVGIAAAVALLALAVPLLGRLDTGSDEDTASSDFEETGAALDERAAEDDASGAGDAPSTTTVAGELAATDLGSFAALPDLVDAVRTGLGSGDTNTMESSPMAATPGSAPCEAEQQVAETPTAYVALAELAGRPVVVMVRAEPDGGHTVVVLDRQDCSTVSAGRL